MVRVIGHLKDIVLDVVLRDIVGGGNEKVFDCEILYHIIFLFCEETEKEGKKTLLLILHYRVRVEKSKNSN